jgi:serine protease Do
MPRFLVIAVLVLVVAAPIGRAQQPGEFLRSNPKFLQSFRDVVQPISPSVVRVQCDGKDVCLGTVVAADGWILVKAHDLTGTITCKLPSGAAYEARLIGVHEPNDLALVQIAVRELRAVTFADSKKTRAGSWVASVGPGSEAAAVGVVSVPTRTVHEAYLGVSVEPSPRGLVVVSVAPKAAAFKAGLRPKDIILDVNRQVVVDADRLQQILGELKPGDGIALRIRRGDKEQEIRATLQSREQVGDFRSEFQNRLGSELSNRRSGYSQILQHDSVLKPTDCGGPLVDLHGKVIGINISRAGRTETWAIPAEVVQPLIAELKSGRLAPRREEGKAK